jgi:hypothetical protein
MALDSTLITFDDLRSIKGNFSKNIDSEQVDPYIREAQIVEIRKLLGDELYLQLIKGYTPSAGAPPNEQRFEDLMTGVEYTNRAGNLVNFNGLEEALKWWSYYRYLNDSDTLNLRFGNRVADDGVYSTSVAREQLKSRVYHAKSMALLYQADAIRYIEDNIGTYEEYNSNKRKKRSSSFSMDKLPKNKDYGHSFNI